MSRVVSTEVAERPVEVAVEPRVKRNENDESAPLGHGRVEVGQHGAVVLDVFKYIQEDNALWSKLPQLLKVVPGRHIELSDRQVRVMAPLFPETLKVIGSIVRQE